MGTLRHQTARAKIRFTLRRGSSAGKKKGKKDYAGGT